MADIKRCARSLEIGAGGGLVGLAVAKGCAVSQSRPLYVTDQLEMLSLMEHNVALNEVQGRVKPMVLNWCVATRPLLFLSPPTTPDRVASVGLPYSRVQYPKACLLGTPGCSISPFTIGYHFRCVCAWTNVTTYYLTPVHTIAKRSHSTESILADGPPHLSMVIRGEPLPAEIVQLQPNIILAAECVYFEPAFPLLLQTLHDLLVLCPAATIYFCFKKRRRADLHFVKKAKKAFNVVEVEDDERSVFCRQGLFLYTITSKATNTCSSRGDGSVQETDVAL